MIRDETSQTQSFRTAARPHRRGALVAARNGTGGSRGGCTGRRRLCRPASRQAGHGRSPRRGSRRARPRSRSNEALGSACARVCLVDEERFSFRLRGAEGGVSVSFQANEDPARWGYGTLGLTWPTDLARGLPVIAARTECELDGYAAVMGWIQVVRIDVLESSQALVDGVDKAPAGHHEWVDGPPQLRGLRRPVHVLRRVPDTLRRACVDRERHHVPGRLVVDGEPGCVDQPRVVPGSRAALGLLDPRRTATRAACAGSARRKRLGRGATASARDVPGLAVQT